MPKPVIDYCSQLKKLPVKDFESSKLGLSTFDSCIFYLLQKILIGEISKESNNYQIIIPDRNYQDDILSSVVLCVALNKYAKNCDNYIFQTELEKGDILYNPSTNSELSFLFFADEKYVCKDKKANETLKYLHEKSMQNYMKD